MPRERSASVRRRRPTRSAAAMPEQAPEPALIADPAPAEPAVEAPEVPPQAPPPPPPRETPASPADSDDDDSVSPLASGEAQSFDSAIPAPAEPDWLDRYEAWVPLALTLLCGFTRYYRLDCPPGVVFDEYHFGRFTNQYSESPPSHQRLVVQRTAGRAAAATEGIPSSLGPDGLACQCVLRGAWATTTADTPLEDDAGPQRATDPRHRPCCCPQPHSGVEPAASPTRLFTHATTPSISVQTTRSSCLTSTPRWASWSSTGCRGECRSLGPPRLAAGPPPHTRSPLSPATLLSPLLPPRPTHRP